MKKLLGFVLFIICAIVLFNLAIEPLLEPGMLYEPTKVIAAAPDPKIFHYREVNLFSKNGRRINGLFYMNARSQKAILYLHGNSDNICAPVAIYSAKTFYALPANVFAIDYQGYGKSEGAPSEENIYNDAEAAYAFLRNKGFADRDIILVGNSLGGAVATYLASRHAVGALVLQRSVASVAEMAVRKNPFYRFPLVWLRSKFDTREMVKKVKAPVLIVHSKQDDLVPYYMGIEIFNDSPGRKKLITIPTGHHDDDIFSLEYIQSLKNLLRTGSF